MVVSVVDGNAGKNADAFLLCGSFRAIERFLQLKLAHKFSAAVMYLSSDSPNESVLVVVVGCCSIEFIPKSRQQRKLISHNHI